MAPASSIPLNPCSGEKTDMIFCCNDDRVSTRWTSFTLDVWLATTAIFLLSIVFRILSILSAPKTSCWAFDPKADKSSKMIIFCR